MKQTFIIECDSEMSTVFLYEAETQYEIASCRWVAVRGDKITQSFPTPKFYGILDSLIITDERMQAKFANVKPITPEAPTPEPAGEITSHA